MELRHNRKDDYTVKLLMCKYCGDIFSLDFKEKECKCKAVKGKYLDNLNAEYSGDNAIPLGFANRSLAEAIKNQPEDGVGHTFNAFVIPKECETFIKKKGIRMKELQSERGIKLVTQEPKCLMLTVEDYMKWYNLYIINEKGEVTVVDSENKKVYEILSDNWFDHCITPIGFIAIAKELGAKVDKQSYKEVINRFIENYYEKDPDDKGTAIDKKYMPSEELKLAVLI